MDNPVDGVFGTVELLESILHKLPTRDLLLAQRVSKHWKVVIEDSPKLQRALFFRPVDVGLLEFKVNRIGRQYQTYWALGEREYPVFKNPLLGRAIKVLNLTHNRLPMDKLPKKWRRQDASWRRMLLTQPAVLLRHTHSLYCTGDLDCSRPIDTNAQRIGATVEEFHAKEIKNENRLNVCFIDGAHRWKGLKCNEQLEQVQEDQ